MSRKMPSKQPLEGSSAQFESDGTRANHAQAAPFYLLERSSERAIALEDVLLMKLSWLPTLSIKWM